MIPPVLIKAMNLESRPGAARSFPSPEEEHTHMLTAFSVSAGMVGVCLTTIGLIQVVEHLKQMETLCDESLVFNALLFLSACIMSYWALHHRFRSHYRRLRLVVDTLLMAGILMMFVVCGMIAYSLM
jgi:cation transport ATPase